jgi:hypothetical protein
LRLIYGPKRGDVTREWRRLLNEELYSVCVSLNIIPAIKSKRMRWVEHVARMGERGGAFRVFVWRPDG